MDEQEWEESEGVLEDHPRCSGVMSYADGTVLYRMDTVWVTRDQAEWALDNNYLFQPPLFDSEP